MPPTPGFDTIIAVPWKPECPADFSINDPRRIVFSLLPKERPGSKEYNLNWSNDLTLIEWGAVWPIGDNSVIIRFYAGKWRINNLIRHTDIKINGETLRDTRSKPLLHGTIVSFPPHGSLSIHYLILDIQQQRVTLPTISDPSPALRNTPTLSPTIPSPTPNTRSKSTSTTGRRHSSNRENQRGDSSSDGLQQQRSPGSQHSEQHYRNDNASNNRFQFQQQTNPGSQHVPTYDQQYLNSNFNTGFHSSMTRSIFTDDFGLQMHWNPSRLLNSSVGYNRNQSTTCKFCSDNMPFHFGGPSGPQLVHSSVGNTSNGTTLPRLWRR